MYAHFVLSSSCADCLFLKLVMRKQLGTVQSGATDQWQIFTWKTEGKSHPVLIQQPMRLLGESDTGTSGGFMPKQCLHTTECGAALLAEFLILNSSIVWYKKEN